MGGDKVNRDDQNTIILNKKGICPLSKEESKEIILYVYRQLKLKGYNPISQIAGYLLTDDPGYITNYARARSLITKIDRYAVLEWMTEQYLNDLRSL